MVAIDPGTNVLLQAPSLSAARHDRCQELLAPGDPAGLDVLRITYSDDPQSLLDDWRETVGEMPARTGIVVVGGAADFEGVTEPTEGDTVAVTTANPNDLTGLGMRLNNYLNDVDPEDQLVVCLDSLTELLQFADIQSAFKFLHMFTGQLREANGIAHFHIDPDAHDTKVISQLKPAFDGQITVE